MKIEVDCYFCRNKIKEVDYKDVDLLKNYISSFKKILPRKYTKLCPKHQRKVARAIKKARIMGLLPFIPE